MNRFKEIPIGKKYNKLTVVEDLGYEWLGDKNKYKRRMVLCKCECGNYKKAQLSEVIGGHIMSCGCLGSPYAISERTKKHGDSGTRLYKIWKGIKKRCLNPKSSIYGNYGGRGIAICDEWEKDWLVFKAWALSNGYTDDLSIDRIDVDGNYEPSNCRWATRSQQNRNQKRNLKPFKAISPDGDEYIVKECKTFCEEHGLNSNSVRSVLRGEQQTTMNWHFYYL